MAGFDGTGPYGDGRPGRGLGPCGRFGRGYGSANYYGRGRNYGGGFRRRNWFQRIFPATYEEPYEAAGYVQQYNKDNLKARKRELENEMKWIDQELQEVEK